MWHLDKGLSVRKLHNLSLHHFVRLGPVYVVYKWHDYQYTLGRIFSFAADNVTVFNHTVEMGKAVELKCDAKAAPPFYYYRLYSQSVHQAPVTRNLYWSEYSIYYMSNSPANLQTIASLLAISEHPLEITNFTLEFHNNIFCCQAGQSLRNQNASSPSMICYLINVQCKLFETSHVAFT